MKITSKAIYYNDETVSDGIVLFTGTGTSYAGEDCIIDRSISLEGNTLIWAVKEGTDNIVKIQNDHGIHPINLAEVENQSEWANTEAGAQIAIRQIELWKKKSSVGTQPAEYTGPVKIRPVSSEVIATPTLMLDAGDDVITVLGIPLSTNFPYGYYRLMYGDGWLTLSGYIYENEGFDIDLESIESPQANDAIVWNGLTFTLTSIPLGDTIYFFNLYPSINETIVNETGGRASLEITGSFNGSDEGIVESDLDSSLGLLLRLTYSSGDSAWMLSDEPGRAYYDEYILNDPLEKFFGFTFAITGTPENGDTIYCRIYRSNPMQLVSSDGIQIIKEVDGEDVVIFKVDADGNITPSPSPAPTQKDYLAYAYRNEAPFEVTEFKNTLGGAVTYEVVSTSLQRITSDGLFKSGKTMLLYNDQSNAGITMSIIDESTIDIDNPNENLLKISLHISVFP